MKIGRGDAAAAYKIVRDDIVCRNFYKKPKTKTTTNQGVCEKTCCEVEKAAEVMGRR